MFVMDNIEMLIVYFIVMAYLYNIYWNSRSVMNMRNLKIDLRL